MPSNTIVSVQTASAQFDDLLDRASHGDEIIITVNGKPVAKLAPIRANRKALPYGLLKGKLMMKADFDEPLPSGIAAKQKAAYSPPPTLARPNPLRQRGRVKGIDDSAFFEPLEAAEFTVSDKQSSR
jgi:prevent-host-death family protein